MDGKLNVKKTCLEKQITVMREWCGQRCAQLDRGKLSEWTAEYSHPTLGAALEKIYVHRQQSLSALGKNTLGVEGQGLLEVLLKAPTPFETTTDTESLS